MSDVTPVLLRRTRMLTVAAAVSTAHWMWGNLYEEIVTTPPALTWTTGQPTGWVSPLALGSPVWYYGPSLPLSVILVWLLAAQLRCESRAGGPLRPARWLQRAGLAVTVAAIAKVSLISLVNPNLRNSDLTPEVRRQLTVLWLTANGAVILLLALTLIALLAWRRLPSDHRTTSTPKGITSRDAFEAEPDTSIHHPAQVQPCAGLKVPPPTT